MRASKNTRIDEGRNFLQERPPDCAAVGASDVLAQVVQEDPVSAEVKKIISKDKLQRPRIVNSPVVPVEDALYILLLLAYSLAEVSVPQIFP